MCRRFHSIHTLDASSQSAATGHALQVCHEDPRFQLILNVMDSNLTSDLNHIWIRAYFDLSSARKYYDNNDHAHQNR